MTAGVGGHIFMVSSYRLKIKINKYEFAKEEVELLRKRFSETGF